MKDLFSKQSEQYSKFRPEYPSELFSAIYNELSAFELAWDVGTGNGQVASHLAEKFNSVVANDISESQLSRARKRKNIAYYHCSEQEMNIEKKSVDLITVGQAIHWFDLEEFFKKARKTIKKDGVLAYWCYGLIHLHSDLQPNIIDFYKNVTWKYWAHERKHFNDMYASIKPGGFGVSKLAFDMKFSWTREHLQGYLESWSSVQTFISREGINPVLKLMDNLKLSGLKQENGVSFPIALYICKPS